MKIAAQLPPPATKSTNYSRFLHDCKASRGGSLRVLFSGPLGADYEIYEDDRIVQVLIVWRLP